MGSTEEGFHDFLGRFLWVFLFLSIFGVLVYHNIFKDKLIGKYTTVAECNYLAVPARLFERAGRCIRDINSQEAHLILSSRYPELELMWKLKIICFAANQFLPTLTHKGVNSRVLLQQHIVYNSQTNKTTVHPRTYFPRKN